MYFKQYISKICEKKFRFIGTLIGYPPSFSFNFAWCPSFPVKKVVLISFILKLLTCLTLCIVNFVFHVDTVHQIYITSVLLQAGIKLSTRCEGQSKVLQTLLKRSGITVSNLGLKGLQLNRIVINYF